MLSFLVRFFIVIISFVLSAAFCATIFYTLQQQGQGVDPLTIEPQVFLYAVGNSLLTGIKMISQYGFFTILGPIFGVILIGFLLRIRTLFYYVPAGGLALLAIPILINYYAQTTAYQQPDENSIFLYMVSGAAAGLFYWMIGGANAVPKRGTSFF